MRINRTGGALIGLTLLLLVLNACQMQTLYSGTMGSTKLQINLPRSLSANTVTNQSTGGSTSRLLLSNSRFLEVIVRQDSAVVTTQEYNIDFGARSVPIVINLQLGRDYVIEVNAYIAKNGTRVCQGFINYNSTKNGAIASCSLVPYSDIPWMKYTSDTGFYGLPTLDINKSCTVQVDLKGANGITIKTFEGIETYIQDNDGTPIAEMPAKDKDSEYTFKTSELHNPILPFYLTYYSISKNNWMYGGSDLLKFF